MATLTTNFQNLSALDNVIDATNSTSPELEGLMNGMLDGFIDDLYSGTYNEQISATSLRANTYAGGVFSATGSFSSSPFTITSISYQDPSPKSTLNMYGSVQGDVYGNVWGSVSRMTYSSTALSFDISGKISLTGASSYSISSISVTYVAGGVTYKQALTGNMRVDAWSGEVTGTVTSFYLSATSGGVSQSIKATSFSQNAALFFDESTTAQELLETALSGADTIQGAGANQELYGFGGNDKLISGGVASVMHGGTGNDTYVVNDAGDVVVEALGEGTDLVQVLIASAGGTYTLSANVENASLLNTVAYNLTGNALDNVLTGNAAANILDGGDGNDTLNGGAGADTLIGGDGNDTYVVDNAGDIVTEQSNEGTDLVQVLIASAGGTYTLSANVENASLLNTVAYNLTGNELDNVLTGNAAANILDGGDGADRLVGGAGNDTYVVDNVGDVVVEAANGGTDTVQSSLSYVLGANVENLTLTGVDDINGTGNTLANVLTGNAGANVLTGGAGNDTYYIDASDTVVEVANGGTDTIVIESDFDLNDVANIENLTLAGAGDFIGTGTAQANTIVGNTGNNALDGGAGVDVLKGGAGDDTYTVDLVTAGSGTLRTLKLQDTVTEAVGEGDDTIVLRGGVALTAVSTLALGANIEHLDASATGSSKLNLAGNAAANTLTGNAANNVLNGGAGADTLIGGDGNDTYVVDNAGDIVTEQSNEGTDLVQVLIASAGGTYTLSANVENASLLNTVAYNLTGNELDNVLTGNAAANILDGGDGADTLNGGAGADTLIGGDGNDTLNGGAGADTLIGGDGDDTYVVDNVGDVVTEQSNEGTDLVQVRIATSGTYTLSANVENASLLNAVAYNLTGNTLDNVLTGNAAANVLRGGDGNDTLNGGAGADRLIGGSGDDIYVIDNVGDVLVENAAEGSDTVQSANLSIDLTLAKFVHIENATLTGAAALRLTGDENDNVLTGNAGANIISGGAGADTLIGDAGNDVLTGGADDDVFRFEQNGGVDTLTDFTSGSDVIELFELLSGDALDGSGLAADAFGNGSAATTAEQRVLYDQTSGNLYLDLDGSGTDADAVLIAKLGAGTALSISDFHVISA